VVDAVKKPFVNCNTMLMPTSLTSITIITPLEIEQYSIRFLALVWSAIDEEKATF
jgi:hypothetical protein